MTPRRTTILEIMIAFAVAFLLAINPDAPSAGPEAPTSRTQGANHCDWPGPAAGALR